jgi:hypothetical protein
MDLVLPEHPLEIEMIKSGKNICERREAVARILEKPMIIK